MQNSARSGYQPDGRVKVVICLSGLAMHGSLADIWVSIAMSALPPKADMCGATSHVRYVPIADIGRLPPRSHVGMVTWRRGPFPAQKRDRYGGNYSDLFLRSAEIRNRTRGHQTVVIRRLAGVMLLRLFGLACDFDHLSVQFCTNSERHLSQDADVLSKDPPPYASPTQRIG